MNAAITWQSIIQNTGHIHLRLHKNFPERTEREMSYQLKVFATLAEDPSLNP